MPPLHAIEVLATYAADNSKDVDILQAANRVFNYLERRKQLKGE